MSAGALATALELFVSLLVASDALAAYASIHH